MSSILELLTSQLGGGTVRQLSRDLGADERSTATAVSGALPVLLGALARNASQTDGAAALSGALERDHDGSVLDDVSGFLTRGDTGAGDGILKHVLGGQRGAVEGALGQQSGLDSAQVSRLMAMLAPLVMGALGRTQRRQRLDAGGVANLLGGEMRQVRQAPPPAAAGLLGQLLDADGDGQVLDDLASKGLGLLGKKFFGGR